MTISVLGSAPFSETLPRSREIFTANGGVHHIERLAIKSSRVTAIFPSGYYFKFREHQPESELLRRNAPYKKILLRQSLRGLDHSEPNLLVSHLAETVEILSYRKMMELWTSEINFPNILANALEPKNFFNSTNCFLRAMSQEGKRERLASVILSANGNKVSSGVLAVMVAASLAEPEEDIHLFGITANRRDYAYQVSPGHLRSQQQGHLSHILPDLKILSSMIANPDHKILIHDRDLVEAVRAYKS